MSKGPIRVTLACGCVIRVGVRGAARDEHYCYRHRGAFVVVSVTDTRSPGPVAKTCNEPYDPLL